MHACIYDRLFGHTYVQCVWQEYLCQRSSFVVGREQAYKESRTALGQLHRACPNAAAAARSACGLRPGPCNPAAGNVK